MSKIAQNEENRRIFDRTLLIRCPPISILSDEKRQRILEFATKHSFEIGQDIIVQDDPKEIKSEKQVEELKLDGIDNNDINLTVNP